jgi:hypothetical protein
MPATDSLTLDQSPAATRATVPATRAGRAPGHGRGQVRSRRPARIDAALSAAVSVRARRPGFWSGDARETTDGDW